MFMHKNQKDGGGTLLWITFGSKEMCSFESKIFYGITLFVFNENTEKNEPGRNRVSGLKCS